MSQNQPGTPEAEQTASHTASTTEGPTAVAVPDEQSPALPMDQDGLPAPRRFMEVIHKLLHELRHDVGHTISLIALHIIALGILDKTPLLALLALR